MCINYRPQGMTIPRSVSYKRKNLEVISRSKCRQFVICMGKI
jgi:hypothetical protein